jgi:hypothetical protein
MTMSTPPRPGPLPTRLIVSWLTGLVAGLVARSLNIPEPLLHSTGVLVFAHVQAVETKAVRTLCPIRLLRHLRSLLR